MKLATIIVALLLSQSAYAAEECKPFGYDAYLILSQDVVPPGSNSFDEPKIFEGQHRLKTYVGCEGDELSRTRTEHVTVYHSAKGGDMIIQFEALSILAISQAGLAH